MLRSHNDAADHHCAGLDLPLTYIYLVLVTMLSSSANLNLSDQTRNEQIHWSKCLELIGGSLARGLGDSMGDFSLSPYLSSCL
jgi:hypothetical protein